MGYSNETDLAIGIKIPFHQLIEQVNEFNIKSFYTICNEGFFENVGKEENSLFHHHFYEHFYVCYLEFFCKKTKTKTKTKTKKKEEIKFTDSSIEECKNSMTEKLKEKNMYEKNFLVPHEKLLSISSWGTDVGTHGTSRDISFDIEKISKEIKEKYEWLKDYSIVMIMKDESG